MKLAHSKVILRECLILSPNAARLHPIFIDFADKLDSLFINAFADNDASAEDYIPNKDPTYSAPLAMNTPSGMQVPCTSNSDSLKILGAPMEKYNMAQSI